MHVAVENLMGHGNFYDVKYEVYVRCAATAGCVGRFHWSTVEEAARTRARLKCGRRAQQVDVLALAPDLGFADVGSVEFNLTKDVEVLRDLGKGAYGQVQLGRVRKNGAPVAIKRLEASMPMFTAASSCDTDTPERKRARTCRRRRERKKAYRQLKWYRAAEIPPHAPRCALVCSLFRGCCPAISLSLTFLLSIELNSFIKYSSFRHASSSFAFSRTPMSPHARANRCPSARTQERERERRLALWGKKEGVRSSVWEELEIILKKKRESMEYVCNRGKNDRRNTRT
jgi:hypothetical protein